MLAVAILAASGCAVADPDVTVVTSDWSGDVEAEDIDFARPPSDYSGFIGAHRLSDGTYLAAGYDDWSGLLEMGSLWRSSDLRRWERVGGAIADQPGQQAILSVAESDDIIVIAVRDLLIDRPSLTSYASQVWTSADGGVTVSEEDVPDVGANSYVAGAGNLNGAGAVVGSASPTNRMTPLLAVRSAGGVWSRMAFDGFGVIQGVAAHAGSWFAFGGRCEGDICWMRLDPREAWPVPLVPAIWRSDDRGATWQVVETDLPSPVDDGSVIRMATVGPESAHLVVETTGDDGPESRLFRSAADDLTRWVEVPGASGFCTTLVAVRSGAAVACGPLPTGPPFVFEQRVVVVDGDGDEVVSFDAEASNGVQQVSGLVVDGDHLVVFGRSDGVGNELALARIPLPD